MMPAICRTCARLWNKTWNFKLETNVIWFVCLFCRLASLLTHYISYLDVQLWHGGERPQRQYEQLQRWFLLNWRTCRFRCGSIAVAVNWLLIFIQHFLRCIRTLHIIWSLMRRRVTRATFLNIVKYFKTVHCVYGAVAFIFFNLFKTSTVQRILTSWYWHFVEPQTFC